MFLARPLESKEQPDADLDRKEPRFSAAEGGFDVHCAVRLAADDDQGRERLVRSFTRPPFALERIEVLRDGRIAYRLKVPRRGRTHRVMTPLDFMARLAALIPAPYIPLVRYHGVFASRSSWRPLVTPKPPAHAATPKPGAADTPPAPAPALSPLFLPPDVPAAPASFEPWVFSGSGKLPAAGAAEPVATVEPTTISVKHWGRLDEGKLFAKSRYIDLSARGARRERYGRSGRHDPCARRARCGW